VKAERVPAIFGSEVFPSPVLERIGQEAGVRYVDELRDDDLPGKPGSPQHTLLALLQLDFVTMIRSLGGDPAALEAADVSDVTPDRATYPPVSGTGPAPLVELERATFAYGRTPVVVDVDLALRPADFVGVVGPSGSGKTTLLKAILGSVTVVCGSVTRTPGLRIGYVPQVESVSWTFPVTVEQVVLMAGRDRRLPWASAAERRAAAALLERLGIGELARRHIRDLSGGQQQRVFLARALLGSPAMLLLDEPTSGVDVRTRHEILHLLAELHAEGIAVVLTTHDLNGMAAHLPDLICLNRTILARGCPHEVLTPPVLERTFGAPMEVLEHMGLPLVVDAGGDRIAGLRRGSA